MNFLGQHFYKYFFSEGPKDRNLFQSRKGDVCFANFLHMQTRCAWRWKCATPNNAHHPQLRPGYIASATRCNIGRDVHPHQQSCAIMHKLCAKLPSTGIVGMYTYGSFQSFVIPQRRNANKWKGGSACQLGRSYETAIYDGIISAMLLQRAKLKAIISYPR